MDNFPDSRSLTATTFHDVRPNDWYYSGVSSAYAMKIMEGTGDGFAPQQTVPWSQAVTIAARVRSAYLEETIPAVEGEWYAPYVAYAEACGILPANHPEGSDWNTASIDRQSIAYLFRAVVQPKDCPAISDQSIPDLDRVDADKREAVSMLYGAGIFTGKPDGSFDPTGLTTRAELATILTRLLRPAYRVGYDSRINDDMRGQERNFDLNSGICYDETAVYLIFREDTHGHDGERHIYRRDKATGEVTTLYTIDHKNTENIYSLSLYDGWLYFIERSSNNDRLLKRLSLADGSMETLCRTSHRTSLDSYLIYDGRIFTLQSGDDFIDTLGELKNGQIKPITKAKMIMHLDGFGGKLYYGADYGNELRSYDLATGKTELLLEDMIDYIIKDGSVIYLHWKRDAEGRSSYSTQLWMASLADTARPVKYGTVPQSAATHYVNLASDGKNIYYIASSSSVLYRLVAGQEAQPVLTNRWATVENPIFWDDCYMAGNPGLVVANYTGEYPVTIGFGTANPVTTNIDHWLGRSALLDHTSFPVESTVYANDEPMGEEQNVAIRRAYYSGNQLILDIDYRNHETEKTHALHYLDLTVTASGVTLAENVRVVHGIFIKPGKTTQLTVVIQGADLQTATAALTDLDWVCGIGYNRTAF